MTTSKNEGNDLHIIVGSRYTSHNFLNSNCSVHMDLALDSNMKVQKIRFRILSPESSEQPTVVLNMTKKLFEEMIAKYTERIFQ